MQSPQSRQPSTTRRYVDEPVSRRDQKLRRHAPEPAWAGVAPVGEEAWRRSGWYRLLAAASTYRRVLLGCRDCGDCIQDHLYYAGCSMGGCYKELRNGPCGGSRPDGSCEARPERPCVWTLVYLAARAAGDDPRKFAHILVPPRDWRLDRTNALANRFADIDNLPRRQVLSAHRPRGPEEQGGC